MEMTDALTSTMLEALPTLGIFLLLGFVGDNCSKAAQVLSREMNHWLLLVFIQKRTWFFKTLQNKDVGYKFTVCHEIHSVFLWIRAKHKSPTDWKQTWVSSIQTIMSIPRDAKILKMKKSSPIPVVLPSKLWGYFTPIPPLHPTTTTHTQPHKTQGIIGCTPTNVPLWEIPIKSPIYIVCIYGL